ncbi:hypothetical protein QR680_012465 [Steinernema hermaphroditum]|uniref:Uncharacterized protein n=1 Tax=Steinernema hermaphroditum TaxID=289476 RepID=A0AA39I4V8_9BILA|nr:hypothetical protein QR680_012465 [Steinernema hermaphroditum]
MVAASSTKRRDSSLRKIFCCFFPLKVKSFEKQREELIIEEAPSEETSLEEPPIEETRSEETPIEEPPIEETPFEEPPIEETPIEETPTEEESLPKRHKIIKFNEYVEVTEAENYDRRSKKPWTKLSLLERARIRKELNDFKSEEMSVHDESKIYTRYVPYIRSTEAVA